MTDLPFIFLHSALPAAVLYGIAKPRQGEAVGLVTPAADWFGHHDLFIDLRWLARFPRYSISPLSHATHRL